MLAGEFRDETRAEIVAVIERMARDEKIDGVILGGTELPLLLRADVVAGLPTLDTTALHVRAIAARLREPDVEIATAPLTGDSAVRLISALNAELAAAREARELGVRRLVLETGTRQLEALRLYRAAGFVDIDPYGEYVASAATSVCLSKVL